jgi:hypothetical protein
MTAIPSSLAAGAARNQARSGSRAISWTLLVALCLLSAWAGRLCYVVRPFDPDGAMFIYLGKMTSEGGRMCHDLVDNKFPGVGLMTSAAWRAFGANWQAYVILQFALMLGAVAMLARTAWRHLGKDAAIATALFALVYFNFNLAVFGGFQLESLQIFFVTLAACSAVEVLCCDRTIDTFVVGLCAGTAILLKPTGIGVAAALAVVLLLRHRSNLPRLMAHAVAMLAGIAIPLGVLLTYLIAVDILQDMPSLYQQIARYAAGTVWQTEEWLKLPIVLAMIGFPFIVRGSIFRKVAPASRECYSGAVTFVLLWLALEVAGIVLQRRMYAYHFLVLAPPAALLFGMIPRKARVESLAAGLVPVALLSVFCGSISFQYSFRGDQTRLAASDYLAAHTRAGDPVWHDEMMRLLIETDLKPGARVPMTFLFANDDQAPLEFSKMIVDDFERIRPKYIVLQTDLLRVVEFQRHHIKELGDVPMRGDNFETGWNRIADYVKGNYAPEARVGRETMCKRKGTAQ